MACAASPSRTRRPENQRRQSTRRTVFTSRWSKSRRLTTAPQPAAALCPRLRERSEIAVVDCLGHRSGMRRCPEVGAVGVERGVAEGAQRRPELFEPRSVRTAHHRPHVAAASGHVLEKPPVCRTTELAPSAPTTKSAAEIETAEASGPDCTDSAPFGPASISVAPKTVRT